MPKNKVLEQQIAVFGEGGSGKTVLLSSFYGASQEPHFLKEARYNVVAEDQGQGNRLHQNYLGMRDDATAPVQTKLGGSSYVFSIKLKKELQAKSKDSKFQALRLVWHDYPGEWFEQGVSGPTEAGRRVETFQSLLGSDVAVLLVDGQKLIDYAGEEERYLKSLFTNFRTGLLALQDDLIPNGKPLVQFPRIWVMALSKSDLLPDWDVVTFRDLLIRKAAGEIEGLRIALRGFVAQPDALSVGEDFLLLSSARFEPNKIEVSQRIGLDLILPLAAILPVQYHLKWAGAAQVSVKVVKNLLDSVGGIVGVLGYLKMIPLPARLAEGPIGALLTVIVPSILDVVVGLPKEKVDELLDAALAKHNYLSAVLAGFINDLNRGVEEQVLFRSLA